MIKKSLKIFKYIFSYIISVNIYFCRYISIRLNFENQISLLEKELQNTQEQLLPMRENLQKVISRLSELLLVSLIKPNDMNIFDIEKREVNFLWDSSSLYGLKYLFGEITYLLFLPRNPRTNKFIGYERVPQDTGLVIIKFIKNDIDNIWIQRDKEIINLTDDKLQTKDVK